MSARRWLILYLALLVASWCVEALWQPEPTRTADSSFVSLPALDDPTAPPVRLAYRDLGPRDPDTPVAVLLHGSPGGLADFNGVAQQLRADTRLLIPDLPGFGASARVVPDYSIEAHGRYVLALLDALEIPAAHWVGFSMGGGVALSAAERAPERVRSLVLLSAIGVQEYELLGDYGLNHLVHGLQLFALRCVDWGVPHFGWLDSFPLNPFYARNFFDSDQRPLRASLLAFDAPTLIIHGKRDPLVPYAAALEHHRLVPQSALISYPEGHFVLWQRGDEVAAALGDFWAKADRGEAPVRGAALAERRAAASAPFVPHRDARGVLAWLAFGLLVLAATLVSEDLTCIGVGFLVARGQVDFAAGVAACAFGLWAGDLMLYGVGRLGSRWIPSRWWDRIRNKRGLANARARFDRAGAALILGSRFLPGARLPIYLAAGAARYPVHRFGFLLLVGAALWTPLLVGGAAILGDAVLERVAGWRYGGAIALAATAATLLVVTRVLLPLLSHRGRRLWRGRIERWRRWEFWPMWLFYPPVVVYVAQLALRFGGVRTATAANPAIPGGGLVGESKWEILEGLSGAGDAIASTAFLPRDSGVADRLARIATRFVEVSPDAPLVLKPDVGERGKGVAIVRDPATLERELAARREDTLIQEYVAGVEFGVFYARRPGAAQGSVISITDKRMVSVTGDGSKSLERLILDDPRAVCLAPVHLETHSERLSEIPAAGTRVALTELGTHCRGALFLDGAHLTSPALSERIEAISRSFAGFFFGRYDVRCESPEALQRGDFRVVELNGLSSESTHIYDPKHSLWNAYRTLFAQWRIAFEIGASNREQRKQGAPGRPERENEGAAVTSWPELWRLFRNARS